MARKPIHWAFNALALRFFVAGILALSCSFHFAGEARAQGNSSPSPAPSVVPTTAPTAGPNVGGVLTVGAFHTSGVNASGALDVPSNVDMPHRADITNLLLSVSAPAGRLHALATAGLYNFPTVGQSINQTYQLGANARLYSELPLAQVAYSLNQHVSVAAGKFAALLGQESLFTYQNVNVQRGIGWAMEPVISRGVRVTYLNNALTLTLEANDAYYSGSGRAAEALIGYAPSDNASVQFAAIVPGRNVGPNSTVSIGNKAEYNVMATRQIGKLQLLPYVLWVRSPASAILGYARGESATAAVLMAAYAISPPLSVAVRYEDVRNASSTTDTSTNADLVGYGPGSRATTFTVTPALRVGPALVRFDYSRVWLSSFAPGSAFGTNGRGNTQDRFAFEMGLLK